MRVSVFSPNASATKPRLACPMPFPRARPVYQGGANSNLCFTERSSMLLKSSSTDKSCLLRFLSCGEGVRYNQQTAARLAETLPESGKGTRPGEAGGDCCRTKPHPSKPEQESTNGPDKQSAKGADCLIVLSVSHRPHIPDSRRFEHRINPTADGLLAEINALKRRNSHCSFAYSPLACFRMGMLGSASFQSVRKSL